MASERILHWSAGVARPKFERALSRHLCRTSRPSSAATSSTSSSSTRALQRDKCVPCRRGGGNKVMDALKAVPKRRPLDLEEDGTSDGDVMADEGSSSDEESILPGRKLARNKRQRLMQMFSGLDSDGMRDEGDGSFLEVSAVRTLTEAIYDREWNQGFQRKMPTTVKTTLDYALDEKLFRYPHLRFGKGFHVSKAEKLGAVFRNFHPQFVRSRKWRVPRFWKILQGYCRGAPARSRRLCAWPELKLPHMVPYQARHSAPRLEQLHNRRSRSGVEKKGRWKARSSLDGYEKSAMVTQAYHRIPTDQRAFYESCARELVGVMMRTRLLVPTPCRAVETF